MRAVEKFQNLIAEQAPKLASIPGLVASSIRRYPALHLGHMTSEVLMCRSVAP